MTRKALVSGATGVVGRCLLEQLVERGDWDVFAVSRRTDTPGQPFHRLVDRKAANQDEIAEVWCDLPLNGAWSDLTATFSVQQRIGHAVLVLQQIHVF